MRAALLAAIVLLIPADAHAVNCALVKRLAAKYTRDQLEQMARNYNLSDKEIRAARACLKDQK